MICCPTCGGTGTVAEPISAGAEIAATAAALREACIAIGGMLTGDCRVDEATAGALIGVKPKTLSNWRHTNRPLVYIKRNGRVLYALTDLARWLIENGRSPEN